MAYFYNLFVLVLCTTKLGTASTVSCDVNSRESLIFLEKSSFVAFFWGAKKEWLLSLSTDKMLLLHIKNVNIKLSYLKEN